MIISTVLNAHDNTELVLDTLDSIKTFLGDNVLVIVDGAAWDTWGNQVKLPAYKIRGFNHDFNRAPYRNLTYGLKTIYDMWPDSDWFCYTEYDVLFTSSRIKEDLRIANEQNIWCLGNDLRIADMKFPYLENILNIKLNQSYYLLGCCVFHNQKFIKKLTEEKFFDKFLSATNEFTQGYFPDYEEQGGYDFGEHLYPTLANYYGGSVGQFAVWNQFLEQWNGTQFKKYPMRWKPEITWEDNFSEAVIMHPLKEQTDLRMFHANKRMRSKCSIAK